MNEFVKKVRKKPDTPGYPVSGHNGYPVSNHNGYRIPDIRPHWIPGVRLLDWPDIRPNKYPVHPKEIPYSVSDMYGSPT